MVDVDHGNDEPNGAPCDDDAPKEKGKRPSDPNTLAKWIVDQATDEDSSEDEVAEQQD